MATATTVTTMMGRWIRRRWNEMKNTHDRHSTQINFHSAHCKLVWKRETATDELTDGIQPQRSCLLSCEGALQIHKPVKKIPRACCVFLATTTTTPYHSAIAFKRFQTKRKNTKFLCKPTERPSDGTTASHKQCQCPVPVIVPQSDSQLQSVVSVCVWQTVCYLPSITRVKVEVCVQCFAFIAKNYFLCIYRKLSPD